MPKEKIEKAKLMEGLAFANDEQRKAFESLLDDEKNLDAFSERYMMRSDYSRAQDAVTKEKEEAARIKADAEEKDRAADAFHQTLTEWEKQIKPKVEAATAYEKYLTGLGLDPATVAKGTATPPPNPSTSTFDEKKFSENFIGKKEATAALMQTVDIPFQLHILDTQHRELYDGKPAPADKLMELKTEFIKTGKSLVDLGADAFHFADRRKELDEKALNDRADAMAQERLEKLISERGLPAATASFDDPTATVFTEDFSKHTQRPDVLSTNPDTYERFNKANAALANGGVHLTS